MIDRDTLVGIGLSGGTSADGIDAALVRFRDGRDRVVVPELLDWTTLALDDDDRAAIDALAHDRRATPRDWARADRRLGQRFADAAQALRAPADFVACGGQTVAHYGPEGTLQIGCPATLAEATGLPVVAGFRTTDVAAGGHGAPLAPFLDWVLRRETPGVALLNLGGIANITWVDADPARVLAFDTGPANSLLDRCARTAGLPFDTDGALARAGSVDEALLATLLADPYFSAPPPKSTGLEQFGDACFAALPERDPADLMATLVALTARTIADALRWLPGTPSAIEISGGGAHNPALLEAIAAACAPVPATPIPGDGWIDAKEAVLFALLGHETLRGRPSSIPGATGAAGPRILGGLYRARP